MRRVCFVALSLVLSASLAWAQKELNTELMLQAQEATVAPGAPLRFTFRVPENPLRFAGVISFEARIDSPRLAGGTTLLWPALNGVKLEVGRHVLRGPQFSFADGRVIGTFSGGGYFLYYAPDYEVANRADSNYRATDGHAYEFKFVVTDLLRDGENELLLENTSQVATRIVKVRNVRFGWENVRPFETEAPQPGPPTGPLARIEPHTGPDPTPAVALDAANGLWVSDGNNVYRVRSSYSLPGGQWERFGATVQPAPTVFAPAASAILDGPSRRIERTVTCVPGRVEVRDRITNKTGDLLPVRLRHEVELPAPLEELVLNGLQRPLRQGAESEPANPTTFLRTASGAVGIMPVDDVTREHSRSFCQDGRGGFTDDFLVLNPAETRETRFWVLPVASGDYYEFVNRIRRAQNTNFRLDGSFAFITAREPFTKWTDEQVGNWADKLALHYACLSIAAPLYHGKVPQGTAFPLIDHTPMKALLGHLKRVRPDLKTLVYFHVFISTEDGASEKYAADRILTAKGTQADYRNPIYPLFFPTETNAYGQAMERNLDIILKDLGADGVYWDELSGSSEQWHYGEPWDGCSGIIDPQTNALLRKVSDITLLTAGFREKVFARLLDAGIPLVGNGNPHTESETKRHFPRFVETGSITNLVKSHLYTPIGLGDHLTERTEQDVMDNIRRFLDYGCLYYYYHQQATENVTQPGLSRYMWPITPLELHPGYILGRERILTNRSGAFGFGDASAHEVHVFDRTGKEVPWEAPTLTEGGKTYTELRLPGGYVAAVVRK